MTATITNMDQWRRSHVRKQCDAISLCEAMCHQYVRWWSACARDQLRYWWHV